MLVSKPIRGNVPGLVGVDQPNVEVAEELGDKFMNLDLVRNL